MDDRVVSLDDMRPTASIDARVTCLLAGDPPAGDPLSEDISVIITQLTGAFPLSSVPQDIADVHMAKMLEVAATLRTSPEVPFSRPAVRRPLISRVRSYFSPLARKVAAVTLSFSAAFSGMAYAGLLPDPLQRTAADLGGLVGLELPDPDEVVRDQPNVKNDPTEENGASGPSEQGAKLGVSAERSERDAQSGATADQDSAAAHDEQQDHRDENEAESGGTDDQRSDDEGSSQHEDDSSSGPDSDHEDDSSSSSGSDSDSDTDSDSDPDGDHDSDSGPGSPEGSDHAPGDSVDAESSSDDAGPTASEGTILDSD